MKKVLTRTFLIMILATSMMSTGFSQTFEEAWSAPGVAYAVKNSNDGMLYTLSGENGGTIQQVVDNGKNRELGNSVKLNLGILFNASNESIKFYAFHVENSGNLIAVGSVIYPNLTTKGFVVCFSSSQEKILWSRILGDNKSTTEPLKSIVQSGVVTTVSHSNQRVGKRFDFDFDIVIHRINATSGTVIDSLIYDTGTHEFPNAFKFNNSQMLVLAGNRVWRRTGQSDSSSAFCVVINMAQKKVVHEYFPQEQSQYNALLLIDDHIVVSGSVTRNDTARALVVALEKDFSLSHKLFKGLGILYRESVTSLVAAGVDGTFYAVGSRDSTKTTFDGMFTIKFTWDFGSHSGSDDWYIQTYAQGWWLQDAAANERGVYFVSKNTMIFHDPTGKREEYNTNDPRNIFLDGDDIFLTGNGAFKKYVPIGGGLTTRAEEIPSVATAFTLHNNYPNPFNPSTQITYTLPATSGVEITIRDLLGREIKTLVKETQLAGTYSITWDATDVRGNRVPSGTYIYTLKSGNYRFSKKMTLLQ